jgi:CYTH domain-containing protein
MGKEIERKFLLVDDIIPPVPEHYQSFHIKQGYLLAEKDKQVRIRITALSAVIGIKFTENIIRDEFEYEIPMDEGLQIYDKLDLKLEKQRTSFNIGRYHYDIDTFPNDMKFCEVEFESIEDMNNWVKPTWLGNEITGVKKYSNIVLAEKKLSFK